MKYKTISVAIIVMLILVGLSFATNINKDASYLKVIAQEVSPEPVEPGQDITLNIRLYNYGDKKAEKVNVKLNAQYPFYLKTESQDFKDYNDICVGCSKKNSYYLNINANAISGIYPIEFEIYEQNGTIKKTEEINIMVIGIPDIIFESNPVEKRICPNDEFKVKFKFKNIGTGIARNIKIVPSSCSFIKLGSGLKIIDELKPDEIKNIDIVFSVAENIEPNTYNIPLSINYLDEQSKKYNLSQNFGIKIVHQAEINLQNLKITPQNNIKKGDEIEVEVRVENIGKGNAKNVKLALESDLEGIKTAYLGMIEKDNDEPTIFTLTASKSGKIKNSLKIIYNDDFGEHQLTEIFLVDINENKNQNSITIIYGVFGLILISAFLMWLMKKNKKNN